MNYLWSWHIVVAGLIWLWAKNMVLAFGKLVGSLVGDSIGVAPKAVRWRQKIG